MDGFSEIKHLSREDIVKNGSVFTPRDIVERMYSLCEPFIDEKTVFGEFGCGYGSFIDVFGVHKIFGTESDETSFRFLQRNFPGVEFHNENSLVGVCREKYSIGDRKLFVIGNPPYNDTTSIYRKGKKGEKICDEGLEARDMGISFLKMYDVLEAEYVCVLHPLAYLIKKSNFSSLSNFREHYVLRRGIVFSSHRFVSIRKTAKDFPVAIALYQRNGKGMSFDYIREFGFEIMDDDTVFHMRDVATIDGRIQKYPRKDSVGGIQFYTLRDMNALLRNKSFIDGKTANGIDVTLDNLYQYSWLFYLKNNFNPKKNGFLYGNLSPLYNEKIELPEIKRGLVSYAYANSEVVRKHFSEKEIEEHYGRMSDCSDELGGLVNELYF